MRFILDTHCWLWWIAEPQRLTGDALSAIGDPDNTVFFSALSSWEIATEYRLGRLPLAEPPDRFVPPRIARDRFKPLPVTPPRRRPSTVPS